MKAPLLSWRFPSAWSGRDTQTETQGSTLVSPAFETKPQCGPVV